MAKAFSLPELTIRTLIISTGEPNGMTKIPNSVWPDKTPANSFGGTEEIENCTNPINGKLMKQLHSE